MKKKNTGFARQENIVLRRMRINQQRVQEKAGGYQALQEAHPSQPEEKVPVWRLQGKVYQQQQPENPHESLKDAI